MALIKPEQLRSGSYTISGSFSGSFFGDGSGLTNLPIDTGSFTTTSSFNSFTSSYYVDSSSFSTRVTNLEDFSSSLDATFATEAELNAATASLSASISNLSSSFEIFSGSYNTGSFSGSFIGNLTGTSSYSDTATSASYALTASYVELAQTASYYDETDPVFTAVSGTFVLTSSFNSFTSSYNTGSFTGSFYGDGSNLTGIVSSKWTGSNPISREGNVEITGSLTVNDGITGSLFGTASWAENAQTASYVLPLNQDVLINGSLNVTSSFTASGLIYPSVDNGEESFIQTDGNGNLSLQYVKTIYEEIVNGESTQLIKGTPVYVSGSQGAASIVYQADAADPTKMPVIYIVADTLAAGEHGRGIALGLIKGVNTTGYPAGTEIYIAAGGGWTLTRPTGSAIVQVLGYVTKEGNGGQGVVLNPGPSNLPNIAPGNVWVGGINSYPTTTPTSSLSVASSSFAINAQTASFAPNYTLTQSFNAFTASYNTGSFTGSFTGDGSQLTGIVSSKWTGSNPISRDSDVEITGSLRVQGSITGSLFGTASFATSASFALTASYIDGGFY